jgi:tRNA(Arg) A34 adenosine deaminase TadA
MNTTTYSKKAVELSEKSYNEGAFPAGALIVRDNIIISEATSAKFPKINFHAESKAIDEAINKLNQQLDDCILYTSMEPCLMCLSRAYWAGIRKINFVIKKESVPSEICYESNHDHIELLTKFNVEIELIQTPELEVEALKVVRKWLDDQSETSNS